MATVAACPLGLPCPLDLLRTSTGTPTPQTQAMVRLGKRRMCRRLVRIPRKSTRPLYPRGSLGLEERRRPLLRVCMTIHRMKLWRLLQRYRRRLYDRRSPRLPRARSLRSRTRRKLLHRRQGPSQGKGRGHRAARRLRHFNKHLPRNQLQSTRLRFTTRRALQSPPPARTTTNSILDITRRRHRVVRQAQEVLTMRINTSRPIPPARRHLTLVMIATMRDLKHPLRRLSPPLPLTPRQLPTRRRPLQPTPAGLTTAQATGVTIRTALIMLRPRRTLATTCPRLQPNSSLPQCGRLTCGRSQQRRRPEPTPQRRTTRHSSLHNRLDNNSTRLTALIPLSRIAPQLSHRVKLSSSSSSSRIGTDSDQAPVQLLAMVRARGALVMASQRSSDQQP